MTTWRFCIAEVATSHEGVRCTTVDLNASVWVWDLADGSLVSTFKSCYSMGGRRLAIDPSGTLCIAGNYDSGRIEAYSVKDGALIWRRKRLRKVQRLAYDTYCDQWMAFFVERPCLFLERNTGKTAVELPGVYTRSVSPYDEVAFVDRQGSTARTEHERYGQMLWIWFDQAAIFSTPSTNVTPAMTSAKSVEPFNARHLLDAFSINLNTMVKHAIREPDPFVFRCRSRTVANTDSIGFVVRM